MARILLEKDDQKQWVAVEGRSSVLVGAVEADANFPPRWDRNSAFQIGQWQINFFFAYVCVNRDRGLGTT
jgi:hypothetical protein